MGAFEILPGQGEADYGRAVVLGVIQDALQKLVDEQSEDQGLWFVAQFSPEANLQEALRKLHAAIEARSK